MKEELTLAHSIMSFENLNEVLEVLDELIDTHSKMIKRYEDRLGVLLRQAKGSNDPRLKSVSSQFDIPQSAGGDPDGFSKNGGNNNSDKKKKEDKKRDGGGEEKGWTVLESEDHTLKIATGSDSQVGSNEISILFKTIETLKLKLPALESSRKMLSELPSQGFKADRKFRVAFRDGLPKYVLPSTEPQSAQARRFRYAEQFRIAVLK